MLQLVKIQVFGRVQGVLFRDYTKRQAVSLSLVGFVMNKDDGSVEIVAKGEEQNINQLIDKVKIGSLFSKVTNVVVEPSIIIPTHNFLFSVFISTKFYPRSWNILSQIF
jgi:acylphosphatase